jgi:mitogen-activated protein kinase organizer 1
MDEAKDSVTSLYITDHEIISGSADCHVRRYDIRNGEMLADFVGSMFAVN